MTIFAYLLLIIFSIAFLYYPHLSGVVNLDDFFDDSSNKEDSKNIMIQDNINSIQASLKDLHLENQIGKLSDSDFDILREELLKEWSHYEYLQERR